MNPKLKATINFIMTRILQIFGILIFALLFYLSTAKIILWVIAEPLINANVNRLLSLIAISPVKLDIGAITEGIRRFVFFVSALLLLATNRSIRQWGFWLACLPLAATLTVAGVSQFWSVAPVFTISRFNYFLVVAVGSVFVGFALRRNQIIWLLEAFAVLMVVGNLIAVLKYPTFAIMQGFRLEEAWQGFFIWKNYLGEIMIFSAIMFLFRLVNFREERWGTRIYSLVFYALSIFILFKSQSATEILSLLAVHIVLFLGILFLKWGRLLKPVHWWIIVVVGLIALLAAWFSRDVWLGFLGRNSSFTGRIPLWEALIPYIKQKLWLGYGFGEAFWKSGSYPEEVRAVAGWPAPAAHNGYIETLLGVGIIGLVLFLGFLIQLGILSLKYFSREHSPSALIFFAWLVNVVVANIADNQMGSHHPFSYLLLVTAFAILLRDKLERKQPSSESHHT